MKQANIELEVILKTGAEIVEHSVENGKNVYLFRLNEPIKVQYTLVRQVKDNIYTILDCYFKQRGDEDGR